MSRSRYLRILGGLGVAALAASGLSACVGTAGGIQAADSWTVLTYEIADTNLEPFMMQDIEEMGQVGSKPGFNLISFVDRAEGYSDSPVLGLPNWTGAKWLQVEPGGSANVLQDFGPVDTGDPALLADFIRESILKFPAAHYALIISDHGASWPGVGGDESADYDSLTLDELNQGIGDGLAGAGVDKLDLLGFDACLMATYEVGSVMAAHADRMVASQELEPGHGWDYTALQAAYRGESVDDVGKAIIDGFRNQAMQEGTENEITLALIDLTKFAEVDSAVSAFAAAMTNRVSDVAPTVGRTLAETLGFGANPDPRYDTQMKDLAILAGEISVDAVDVADEADGVVRAVNDVVIDKVDGQATRGATGLSIYFPPDGKLYNPDYSAVAATNGWADFLAAYYQAGSDIPQGDLPAFVTNDAQTQLADGGLYIQGTFGADAESNISDAYIQYGLLAPDGSVTFFGEEPAKVSTDGTGVASAFYDLTSLKITDGEDSADAYLSLTEDASSGTSSIDVPINYYAPNSGDPVDALLTLGLDPATGEIVSQTYYAYNPDTGTYGELTAEPTGLIQPLNQFYDITDGSYTWQPTSETGLYAQLDSLQYSLEPLPSGTQLYIELWVVDFGGNADYVNAVVTVP